MRLTSNILAGFAVILSCGVLATSPAHPAQIAPVRASFAKQQMRQPAEALCIR